MPPREPITAVLWDLDGTLVESERLHQSLEREVLARLGVAIEFEDFEPFVGSTTRALFEHFLAREGRGAELQRALALKRELAPQHIVARTVPIRGAESVMVDLPMRTHRFALVTSAQRSIAVPILERFGWTWRFEVVVTADDVRHPKPAPDPYQLACEQLGIQPRQALAVEDSPNGIRSARQAGCRVAAVPTTFEPAALQEADFVVSQVSAVVGLLGVLS